MGKKSKHLSKRKILDEFTFNQLKEISEIFKTGCKGKNKKELIECIEKKKSVSKSVLTFLLKTEGDMIKSKIKNSRRQFYEYFVKSRNDELLEIYDNFGRTRCNWSVFRCRTVANYQEFSQETW